MPGQISLREQFFIIKNLISTNPTQAPFFTRSALQSCM
nr:MAG TPA: hypothetical protein [Caudoviricetes sp.]